MKEIIDNLFKDSERLSDTIIADFYLQQFKRFPKYLQEVEELILLLNAVLDKAQHLKAQFHLYLSPLIQPLTSLGYSLYRMRADLMEYIEQDSGTF